MNGRFILIDPSIEGFTGHHLEYALHVLRAAQEAGYDPLLVTNRRFSAQAETPFTTYRQYKYGFWSQPFLCGRGWLKGVYRFLRNATQRNGKSVGSPREGWGGSCTATPGATGATVQLSPQHAGLSPQHEELSPQRAQIRPQHTTLAHMALWAAHCWRDRFCAPIRAGQFARDTADLLQQIRVTAADLLFLPGAGQIELTGLLRTFRRLPEAAHAQWHLVFRRDPPLADSNAAAHNRLLRAFAHLGGCARNLPSPDQPSVGAGRGAQGRPQCLPSPAGRGAGGEGCSSPGQGQQGQKAAGHVHFYTDTEELSRQYEALAGRPFRTLPIPHTHAAPRGTVPIFAPAREASGAKMRLPPSLPKTPAGPLRILCLGDARKEKGFHHLPAVLRGLWADCVATGRITWTIQANPALTDDEPEIRAAREQLRSLAGEAVVVLTEALTSEPYGRLLLSGDIILLPYDPAAYRWRSSGILVEALAAGIPPIVPADTWLARQVPAEVGLTYTDIRQVPWLIRELVGNYDHYRSSALAFSESWIEKHNAASLIEMLSYV